MRSAILGPVARTLHSTDALLDAAREVVLQRGPRAATITAIAAAAAAPVGSIYHRFSSVDEMVARAWLRAVRGTHSVRPDDAAPDAPTVEIIVALALALYDHCVAEPRDVLLLDRLRPSDVMNLRLSPETREEINDAQAQTARLMGGLAEALLGRARGVDVDLLTLATVDLPFSFAQRYLQEGQSPPRSRRDRLPAAVRAVVGAESH